MIESYLKKISSQKALVIGDVMLDEYLWGKVDRVSPEAPVPIVLLEHREQRLGGAANVALNLRYLGVEVSVASVIGNDANGKTLLKLLNQQQINTDCIIETYNRITTCKTRVLARNQQMIRVDDESTQPLDSKIQIELIKNILALIDSQKPDYIIFEDYDKGVLFEALIDAVIKKANEKNIITAVDPKRRNFFLYKQVTLFKPNLRELKDALNIDTAYAIKDLTNADNLLREKLNHQHTIITLSEHGVYYATKNHNGNLPAYIRRIADVSGAGDTVIAVAASALAAGYDIKDAAWLSNLAGGLVCEYAGVVPVTPEMLREVKE